MPFKSEKQRRYLWMKEPELARKWTNEYGSKPRRKKRKPQKRKVGVLDLASN